MSTVPRHDTENDRNGGRRFMDHSLALWFGQMGRDREAKTYWEKSQREMCAWGGDHVDLIQLIALTQL